MGETDIIVRDGDRQYSAPDVETARQWQRQTRIGPAAEMFDPSRGWIPISAIHSDNLPPRSRSSTKLPLVVVLLSLVGLGSCAIVGLGGLALLGTKGNESGSRLLSVRDQKELELVTTYNDDASMGIKIINRTGRDLTNVVASGEWYFKGATKPIVSVVRDFGDIPNGATVSRVHPDWAAGAFLDDPSFNEFGLYEADLSRTEKMRRFSEYKKTSESTAVANSKIAVALDQTRPQWRVQSGDRVFEVSPRIEHGFPRREAAENAARIQNERMAELTMEKMVRLGNLLSRSSSVNLTLDDEWGRQIQVRDLGNSNYTIVSGGPDGQTSAFAESGAGERVSDDIVYNLSPRHIGFVQSPSPTLAAKVVAKLNAVQLSWQPQVGDAEAALLTVERLEVLRLALSRYLAANRRFPSDDEGLAALVPEYVDGGTTIDGWGRQFHFDSYVDTMTVASFGADGRMTQTVNSALFDSKANLSLQSLQETVRTADPAHLKNDLAYRHSHMSGHTGFYWVTD